MRNITTLLLAGTLLAACGGGGKKNTTPPPASSSPPDTTISSTPAAATRATDARFEFTSATSGATFEASLDDAAFAAVTSPATLSGLADGTHTYRVRVRDANGVVDPSPATFTWAVDHVPPSARIVFPTTTGYSDATAIAVRGNSNDAHGVSEVRVNGVLATTIDSFQNWRADVPLTTGDNLISVDVTDSAGNVANGAAAATVTNHGPPVYSPRAIDVDATGQRLITVDGTSNIVYSFSLADGTSRLVSPASAAITAANGTYNLVDLVVDAPRNRALLLDATVNAVIAVDLANGARTNVAPASQASTDTNFVSGAALTVDGANNRAWVTNPTNSSIIGVDLATGARSVVSSATVGTGAPFDRPAGIAYDPGVPRLLVSEGSRGNGRPDHIWSVDPVTGNRTVFSSKDELIGTGVTPESPTLLRFDAQISRLYVLDADGHQVFALDGNDPTRIAVVPRVQNAIPRFTRTLAVGTTPSSGIFVAQFGGTVSRFDGHTGVPTSVADASVGSGLAMSYPEGLVVEQANGTASSLLLTDRSYGSVIRVNLATGARSVVSGAQFSKGTGPDIFNVSDLVIDTRAGVTGRKALALVDTPLYSVVSVDLETGNRTVVQPLGVDLTNVGYSRSMRLDAPNNRAYFSVTGTGADALYSLDLASGAVSGVTGTSRGTGHTFQRASTFVIDGTRALVGDEGPGGVYAVDLATGNRSEFVAPWAEDPEPGASVMGASYLDAANTRLLGMRVASSNNLFSVSLATGAQRVISGEDAVTHEMHGRGPIPYGAFAMDVKEGVAYVAHPWAGAVFAIDLVSGDRTIIAR
ncbi:MAG TPA: hypothetical protein VMF52_19255 [Steroidobacteraceae bacterium]|nr:hypothetical protein [Steroidobacteraceae bacterium]